MVCFILLDATMKFAMSEYSLVQVTWGRFFFATVAAVMFCGSQLPALIKTKSPASQIIRSVLLMATTGMFNAGIMTTPLATATTLMFMSPILLTVLSALLLGEHVGVRRWTSIGVGFIGALVVTRVWETGLNGLSSGSLFILAAALTNASYQIATRKLRGDLPLTTLLFTASTGALISTALLPWHWQAPTGLGWPLLIGAGLAGCIGHLCLIKAFQNAPASVVAPFSYSSLVWATLLGFLIWHDVPHTATIIGAALIIGSGFYIFVRERKPDKAAVPET